MRAPAAAGTGSDEDGRALEMVSRGPVPRSRAPSCRSGASARPTARWWQTSRPGCTDSGTTGMSASGSNSSRGTHIPWSSPRAGSSRALKPAARSRAAAPAARSSPGLDAEAGRALPESGRNRRRSPGVPPPRASGCRSQKGRRQRGLPAAAAFGGRGGADVHGPACGRSRASACRGSRTGRKAGMRPRTTVGAGCANAAPSASRPDLLPNPAEIVLGDDAGRQKSVDDPQRQQHKNGERPENRDRDQAQAEIQDDVRPHAPQGDIEGPEKKSLENGESGYPLFVSVGGVNLRISPRWSGSRLPGGPWPRCAGPCRHRAEDRLMDTGQLSRRNRSVAKHGDEAKGA